MGRLRGRSSGLGTFLSAARSASTEGDLGILLPRSPQLQGHLHLKWEPGPLAACLRLIARPGSLLGEQRALNPLTQSAGPGEGAVHIKGPELPYSSLPAPNLPSATFHQCPGGGGIPGLAAPGGAPLSIHHPRPGHLGVEGSSPHRCPQPVGLLRRWSTCD